MEEDGDQREGGANTSEEASDADVDDEEDSDCVYSEDSEDIEDESEDSANNDGKYAENGSNENWKDITGENNELRELLFGLSLALCTERSIDSQPSSILLVYFSGVLGFSTSSKAFLPARSYTSYLSGLIYIQRLLFLEQALPLRPYGVLGIDKRPRVRQLERLQAIRKKWMIIGSHEAVRKSTMASWPHI